ncbi:MAG: hypothetical protein HY010_05885 [Acidobacteria bacterium]|nr:hypothetical protein [Acidobacteriota bacterium]
MSQRVFLPVVSMALTLLVPVRLLGQESASGMVYVNGSATVNGTEIPKSVAVFPGDALETKQDASATINTNGSSVMVFSDSLVKYEGPSVGVDRGSVRVNTGSGFEAHACEVKARPVNNTPTQYQFTHTDGHVTVIATKGDVTVEDHQDSKTVKEGEQATRDDGCAVAAKKNPKRRPGATTAAGGGILSSPTAVYTGIAIVGGITTWVWLQGDDPISPACPTNDCNK